jgi:hypothetical protein
MKQDEFPKVSAKGFTVCDKPCDECLFSPNRIVDGDRAAEVIRACTRRDTYFVCHRFDIGEDEAHTQRAYSPQAVCCRGYYDSMGQHSQQIRMAQRLGIVVFVDENGNVTK